MFQFLFSKDAIGFNYIQIDANCLAGDDVIATQDDNNVDYDEVFNEPSSDEITNDYNDEVNGNNVVVSADSGLNDSCATDLSMVELTLAEKEEEIKQLKNEAKLKDKLLVEKEDLIHRKDTENKKLTSKYSQFQQDFAQIKRLIEKNSHHIDPHVEELREAHINTNN